MFLMCDIPNCDDVCRCLFPLLPFPCFFSSFDWWQTTTEKDDHRVLLCNFIFYDRFVSSSNFLQHLLSLISIKYDTSLEQYICWSWWSRVQIPSLTRLCWFGRIQLENNTTSGIFMHMPWCIWNLYVSQKRCPDSWRPTSKCLPMESSLQEEIPYLVLKEIPYLVLKDTSVPFLIFKSFFLPNTIPTFNFHFFYLTFSSLVLFKSGSDKRSPNHVKLKLMNFCSDTTNEHEPIFIKKRTHMPSFYYKKSLMIFERSLLSAYIYI
jgi:hypothetical protein